MDNWVYYFKVNGCPARKSTEESCVCWHKEGEGPVKGNKRVEGNNNLDWKQKPTNKVI
tara:strand:- start:350 stop:523 length:174 start_codon:yes stop_codon:yes gene_type:complete